MLGLWPELTRFGGASGALHAGLAAASVVLAVSARSRRRLLALCVLGGLIVKTMLEQPFLQTLRFDVDLGLNVAVVAHGSGVLCGALSALAVLALGRLLPAWGTKCGSRQGRSFPGASHPEGDNR